MGMEYFSVRVDLEFEPVTIDGYINGSSNKARFATQIIGIYTDDLEKAVAVAIGIILAIKMSTNGYFQMSLVV